MCQMEKTWNIHMDEHFNPSWINLLHKIVMEWFNKYAPELMCVGRKPRPFGNEIHAICCIITSIFCRSRIVEGKDRPEQLGQKEYNKFRKTVSLMLRCVDLSLYQLRMLYWTVDFVFPYLLKSMKQKVCMWHL